MSNSRPYPFKNTIKTIFVNDQHRDPKYVKIIGDSNVPIVLLPGHLFYENYEHDPEPYIYAKYTRDGSFALFPTTGSSQEHHVIGFISMNNQYYKVLLEVLNPAYITIMNKSLVWRSERCELTQTYYDKFEKAYRTSTPSILSSIIKCDDLGTPFNGAAMNVIRNNNGEIASVICKIGYQGQDEKDPHMKIKFKEDSDKRTYIYKVPDIILVTSTVASTT